MSRDKMYIQFLVLLQFKSKKTADTADTAEL